MKQKTETTQPVPATQNAEREKPLYLRLLEEKKHPKTSYSASVQYRELAINNLHILAEALQNIVDLMKMEALSERYPLRYDQAKEALKAIS